MEGLQHITSLQSLWLGKNKIEHITSISQMCLLKQLDIQNNRLTSLHGIQDLISLEELYLAHNKIPTLEYLPSVPTLNTIDISSNGLESLEGVETQYNLTELWMNGSKFSRYDELTPLLSLKSLTCIYLEFSPIASDYEYRMRITSMLPTLVQLDATYVTKPCIDGNNKNSTSKATWNMAGKPSILSSSNNFVLKNNDIEEGNNNTTNVDK